MKKIISFALALLLCLMPLVYTRAAGSGGTLTVGIDTAEANRGETVTLAVTASENPGICAFTFALKFDKSILKLQKVEKYTEEPKYGILATDGSFVSNPDSALVTWASTRNVTETGVLFWLTFEVVSETAGEVEVELTLKEGYERNLTDENANPVKLAATSGKIVIAGAASGTEQPGGEENTGTGETVEETDEPVEETDEKVNGTDEPDDGTAEDEENEEMSGNDDSGNGETGSTASTPIIIINSPVRESASAANAESIQEKASGAVAELARTKNESSGMLIKAAGSAVTVKASSDKPALVTLALSQILESVTAMAALNLDGTLTPVPAKTDSGDTVTVLISSELTLVPLNVAAQFDDIGSHWGKSEIERAASRMIVEGVGNGRFNPDAAVTNAESVTMFMRALGIPAQPDAEGAAGIDQSKWYAANMNTAVSRGLTEPGIEPDTAMSRIETAALIINALKVAGFAYSVPAEEARELLAQYSDLDALGAKQRENLAICIKLGIFLGNGDGTISPNGELLRAQMAALAVRVQNLIFAA